MSCSKRGYEDNGLLDRILFVMPKSYLVPRWTESEEEDTGSNPASAWRTWEAIMEKVFALDYEVNDEGNIPHLIGMEAEAKRVFFNWHNNTIERINAIRDEALVESRPMKNPVQVARLALILQVLSYACGESHLQFVTTTAIEGAIRLNDYFEASYRRICEYVANDACDEPSLELLALLKDTFTTAEALDAGRQLKVTERTVMNYLKELAKNRLIHKIMQGVYEKVSYTPMEHTENGNCNV